MDSIKVNNILIAVSNKPAIDSLIWILKENNVKIWATEGTAKYVKVKGYSAQSIVSGFDFDGRVKSLDKLILARVLADRSKDIHLAELKKLSKSPDNTPGEKSGSHPEYTPGVNLGEPFDAVVVELYKLDKENFPESMDIGGVTLVRASIKNFENVALAFDETSIFMLTEELKAQQGSTLLSFRKKQAKKAADFISERCKLEAELLSGT